MIELEGRTRSLATAEAEKDRDVAKLRAEAADTTLPEDIRLAKIEEAKKKEEDNGSLANHSSIPLFRISVLKIIISVSFSIQGKAVHDSFAFLNAIYHEQFLFKTNFKGNS